MRLSKVLLVIVCLFSGVSSTPSWCDEPAGLESLGGLRGSARVNALVDLVVERQRAVESLESHFVQIKESALLLEPTTSTGRFRFKAPDRVRWDYETPEPMVVVFSGETLTTYRPDDHVAERVSIPKKHRRFVRILAGTQPLDELKTQFSMTFSDPGAPAPVVLELKPLHRTIKKKLEAIRLEIDRTLLLPVIVEYREADGDSTRYEFHDLQIDPELDDSTFELDLGPDVRIEEIDADD